MKHIIHINQAVIVSAGFADGRTDLDDWAIIYFISALQSNAPTLEFVCVIYSRIMAEIPLLRSRTRSAISQRISKIANLGLIVVQNGEDGKVYARLSPIAQHVVDNTTDTNLPLSKITEIPCLLCDRLSHIAIDYKMIGGYPVCFECAEIVSNVWSKKHSGQYISWPNPPPEITAYHKAKISQRLRTQVFERDAYRCVICGSHRDLAADHIHPESKGGEARFENLQTMCRPCNSKKGNKLALEVLG